MQDFTFKSEIEMDAEAVAKEFTAENKPRVQKLREALARLEPYDHEAIGATIGSGGERVRCEDGSPGASDARGVLGETGGSELVSFDGDHREADRAEAAG